MNNRDPVFKGGCGANRYTGRGRRKPHEKRCASVRVHPFSGHHDRGCTATRGSGTRTSCGSGSGSGSACSCRRTIGSAAAATGRSAAVTGGRHRNTGFRRTTRRSARGAEQSVLHSRPERHVPALPRRSTQSRLQQHVRPGRGRPRRGRRWQRGEAEALRAALSHRARRRSVQVLQLPRHGRVRRTAHFRTPMGRPSSLPQGRAKHRPIRRQNSLRCRHPPRRLRSSTSGSTGGSRAS